MRETDRRFALVTRLLALGLLIGASAVPARADFQQQETLAADHVVLRNLIGQVEIEGHDKADFQIEIHVQGRDASKGAVRLETREGSRAEWNIVFPEAKRFVYPRLGSGTTRINFDEDADRGWLATLLGALGGGIKISGRGSGVEVWADATIRVPRGKTIEVELGLGEIAARGLEGHVTLSSRSGPVGVDDVEGQVVADTGSGKISIDDVRGSVVADTGSGRISVSHCECDVINADTGSGRVELDSVNVERLLVDTGSGRVEARGVAADEALIDTGSGGVLLELTRMGAGRFEIDTGSGGIELVLPADASAQVSAETGSGGIRIDLAGDHDVRHKDRNEAKLRIGGGAARVVLDTGSGGIRISQAN